MDTPLDASRQAMIEAVVATVGRGAWRPVPGSMTRSNVVVCSYIGISIGQREVRLWEACRVERSDLEWLLNPHPQLEQVKRAMALDALRARLKRQLTSRVGLPGHRGWFRIRAIRPMTA